MRRKLPCLGTVLALALAFGATQAYADTDIFDATHNYDWNGNVNAMTITVDVDQVGGLYLWQYTVTNNSFSPGNGFSGFELALPAAPPPDLGNITSPNSNWVTDCCSGEPVEWDIPDTTPNAAGSSTFGPGILVGETGVFSFTTLPRTMVNSTGWFHTWEGGTQTNITDYSATPGALGPEAPNLLVTGIVPEPGTLSLLGIGGIALLARLRRRRPLLR